MLLRDIFDAAALALHHTTVASNNIPYLGTGLFPPKKKMGLDLKWIKTRKGLPISLAPSNFDAVATLRSRVGIEMAKTQMAFFRESFLIKEEDEQEIMRVQDSSDPYAQPVLDSIYQDGEELIAGAEVVPERMIMQLLAPETGSPAIYIKANGVTYAYDYDPDKEYQKNNYIALSGTSLWTDTANAVPIKDLNAARKKVYKKTGTMPTIAIMSQTTFDYLLDCDSVRNAILAQNATANIIVDDDTVKAIIKQRCQLQILIYEKMYKDEDGNEQQFYPDNYVTLIPNGQLGNTWYGTTPEERTLMQNQNKAEVSMAGVGVAVAVTTTDKAPIQTQTTVSEIVLPSYERMDETYVLKVAG
jgi:hypothetical protein